MRTTGVEITLEEWEEIHKRQRIEIPDVRHFFPYYEVPFTIHTDIRDYTIVLHRQRYAPDHFHLGEWFSRHEELKPGVKLVIEIIEPMKSYRLGILKE